MYIYMMVARFGDSASRDFYQKVFTCFVTCDLLCLFDAVDGQNQYISFDCRYLLWVQVVYLL